jgi:predicted Zn finger-like uncharacterized protein
VKTRCPSCHTVFDVDAEALLARAGEARCGHCESAFDAIAERLVPGGDETSRAPLFLDAPVAATPSVEVDEQATDLPFEVPADLPPLEPSPGDALHIDDALAERRGHRGFVYGLLAILLLVALAAQLAWLKRERLLAEFPQLEIVCDHLPCRPDVVHQPDAYRVVSRAITPTQNQPGSLTLSATIRNDAEHPQYLPDIQLSLLDNNGSILARRRLSPDEYLYPRPAEGRLVAKGEVLTIAVDFADPGHIASGFSIDFF